MCDAFAGTLSVALAMKRAGYSVAANDINHFSYTYAAAFLANSTVPVFPIHDMLPDSEIWMAGSVRLLADQPRRTQRLKTLAAVLTYLEKAPLSGLRRQHRRSDFFDHYTIEGKFSHFRSSRGRSGRRRFFTPSNGRRIDFILCSIRQWLHDGLLSPIGTAMLSAIACDAIEHISSTQGTYHDFPRDDYEPRALRSLRLKIPDMTFKFGKPGGHIISRSDALEFISTVPNHDVLYIDPPYNFRQYTAYYFMLNLVCRYPTIPDLDDYFSGLSYVRGQNMVDDFKSPFCSSSLFLDSLESLISSARTETIILSYFDGRNHWNNSASPGNGVGVAKLKSFFRSSAFRRNSLRVHAFPRLNYQSYGGHRARPIDELLLVARKR